MNAFVKLFLLAALAAACSGSENERLRIENAELRKNLNKLKETAAETSGQTNDHKQRLDFLAARMRGAGLIFKTNMGDIRVELYPEKAPITCLTFISRAEAGFYNGTQFHRIMKDFMIQGGDPNSKDSDPNNDGQGGPKVSIPHEFNDIAHTPGILSMARVPDIGAGAGSQFFIMHGTAAHLDGQYTAFGKVTSGMDIVNKIATLPTDAVNTSRTVKPVVLNKVEIVGL